MVALEGTSVSYRDPAPRGTSVSYSARSYSSMTASQLHEVHANWLRTFKWDWMCTFTFGSPTTEQGARFLLNNYISSLEALNMAEINGYWALERGPAGGNVHLHALIGNIGTVLTDCGTDFRKCGRRCGAHVWTCGRAIVTPYNPERAGTFYVSKCAFPEGTQQFIHQAEWDFIGWPRPLTPSVH
jgi:hypothetical protein